MNLSRAVAENPDLRVLTAAERESLAQAMNERRVPAGTELIQQGSSDRDLYLVLSGRLDVRRRPAPDEEDQAIGTLGPGSLVGLVSLLTPGPRSGSCVATTDCVVAVLPYGAFSLLYATGSGFSLRFRYLVARQIARDLHRRSELLRAADPAVGG